MPKETLKHTKGNREESYVDISWGGASVMLSATGDVYTEEYKEALRDEYDGNIPVGALDAVHGTVNYWELSRTEINRIIKILRRARDMTYGKDE